MLGEKIYTIENSDSFVSEIYRNLRTNIEFGSVVKKIKTINITSTIANESKTTTACNLAVMYSHKYPKVLLIDADLRKPSIHHFFKIKNKTGLSDCILNYTNNNYELDKVKLNNYIQTFNHDSITYHLDILTTGTAVSNPAELLDSQAFKTFLNQIKEKYDIIILDNSPAGIVVDGVIVSSICDATLFVIEYNKVKVDIAKKTIENLKEAGANIIGAMVNKKPISKRGYKQYYYNYYYSKDYGKDE